MGLHSTLRSVARMPAFAAATIATVAIGVGATSAMFGVVYAVLIRPLPYPDPSRLAVVWEKWQVGRDLQGIDPIVAARLAERSVVMTSALDVWRKENHAFEDLAGFSSQEVSLSGNGEAERVEAVVASSSLFRVLGLAPALGRGFTSEEDVPGRDEVAVLSHDLWTRRFAAEPRALGTKIGIDGRPHVIVGVMPAGFRLVLPHTPETPQLIVPIPHAYRDSRRWSLVMTVGRLKPGTTIAGAQADMSALVHRMAETNRRYRTRDANVVPLTTEVSRDSRLALLVVFGATGCVLLIGCINVAHLLLLRSAARWKDLAIRTVLGAERRHLIGIIVSESVGLSCVGGLAGLALAYWGTRLLVRSTPDRLIPRIDDVSVDPMVFAFGLGLSLLVGVAAAVAPTWRTLTSDRHGGLNRILKEAVSRTSSGGRRLRVIRRALVATQVAIAMVMLVGAGLLTETYVRLTKVDLGVDAHRVLTFGLTLPETRYRSPESGVAFTEELIGRLSSLPGVDAVGLTNSLPVEATWLSSTDIAVDGQPAPEVRESVDVRTVSPGFFRAAGVRTAYGRVLTGADANAAVTVVNRVLVRRFWPTAGRLGPEPLGRRLRVGDRWCTIVGVVEDVKYSGPARRAEQEVYVPLAFWPIGHVAALLRTPGDPMALAPLARAAVREIDTDVPMQDLRTLEAVASESVAPQRFRFVLMSVFAALALVLAIVGLYGVIAQSVAQRIQEIGIRMALGATGPAIVRMVLAEVLAVVAAGVVLGIAISVSATRVLSTFLFGVSALNPTTYVSVALALVVTAAATVYGPAHRAGKADPIAILRGQ